MHDGRGTEGGGTATDAPTHGFDPAMVADVTKYLSTVNADSVKDDKERGVLNHDGGQVITGVSRPDGVGFRGTAYVDAQGNIVDGGRVASVCGMGGSGCTLQTVRVNNGQLQATPMKMEYMAHTHGDVGKGRHLFSDNDKRMSIVGGAPVFMSDGKGDLRGFKPTDSPKSNGTLICSGCIPVK